MKAVFHQGAILAEKLIRQGLAQEDDQRRAIYFEKAVELIRRQVRSEQQHNHGL